MDQRYQVETGDATTKTNLQIDGAAHASVNSSPVSDEYLAVLQCRPSERQQQR